MKFCPYCHRMMKKVYTSWVVDYIQIHQPVWHCCCGILLYKLPKDVTLPENLIYGIKLGDNYFYTCDEDKQCRGTNEGR